MPVLLDDGRYRVANVRSIPTLADACAVRALLSEIVKPSDLTTIGKDDGSFSAAVFYAEALEGRLVEVLSWLRSEGVDFETDLPGLEDDHSHGVDDSVYLRFEEER